MPVSEQREAVFWRTFLDLLKFGSSGGGGGGTCPSAAPTAAAVFGEGTCRPVDGSPLSGLGCEARASGSASF